jgi:hypothetical protein
MKIAYCLYGQPRDYENGYKNIMNYIKSQEIECDFFFHAWYNNNDFISQSAWAEKRNGKIKITQETLLNVINLYKPKDYIIEEEKKFSFTEYDSLMYKETKNKLHISNVMSSLYTTQSSFNIMNDYNKKYNINYDFIFVSRFDFLKQINLNLKEININYIYSSDIHFINKRKLISPALICGEYNKIYKLHNKLFSNIINICNNVEIKYILNKYNFSMIINHEELVMANLFYNKLSIDDIIFTPDIPNFI